MKKRLPHVNRRAFLRGSSNIFVSLPLTQFAMMDNKVAMANNQGVDPFRLITFYFPNGCGPEYWNYSHALSPLLPLKQHIVVLRGLNNKVSEQAGDDEHAQGGVNLFTGVRLFGRSNQESTKIKGESLDQFASRTLDKNTAYGEPLVTGLWRGYAGGQVRPSNWFRRSWKLNPAQGIGIPKTPISNPRDIYNAVFGIERADNRFQNLLKASILDTVIEDYKSNLGPNSKLNQELKHALTEHTDNVRSIEQKIAKIEAERQSLAAQCKIQPPASLGGGLLSYEQFASAFQTHIDLTALAIACGLTNTASLMFCCAGEEYLNRSISDNVTDHESSHYGSSSNKRDVFLAYRRFHMNNLRRLMTRLIGYKEVNNTMTVLDRTVIVVGSEFGDSKTIHVRSPQPHLLIGGQTKIRTGTEIDVQGRHTPNDVYRAALSAVNINVQAFGEPAANGGNIPNLLL